MSTHKVCFYGEIRKIIPELSSNTPPYNSTGKCAFGQVSYEHLGQPEHLCSLISLFGMPEEVWGNWLSTDPSEDLSGCTRLSDHTAVQADMLPYFHTLLISILCQAE